MKKFTFWYLLALLSALYGCSEKEGPFTPDSRFADSYYGKTYTINADFSPIFTNDTVNFTFKDIETSKLYELSALVLHMGQSGTSFKLSNEIPDGEYLFLTVEFIQNKRDRRTLLERGINIPISFSSDGASVGKEHIVLTGNKLKGEGTEDNPYWISCGHDLKIMQNMTNHEPHETFCGKYCSQTQDISIYSELDFTYGWVPISNYPDFPFKGEYNGNHHKISDLIISNKEGGSKALFGCAQGATFRNIIIEEPVIDAYIFVAPLVSAIFTSGSKRYYTYIDSVEVRKPVLNGVSAIGGLVSSVDQYAVLMVNDCKVTDATINGDYGVGGFVGVSAIYSTLVIDGVSFEGNISSVGLSSQDPVGLVGGILGTADTVSLSGATTRGSITVTHRNKNNNEHDGAGIGGMIGGCGLSQVVGSINYMKITTNEDISKGVGGIVGSTSLGYPDSSGEELFNNVTMVGCGNKGKVIGKENVAGLLGEGQGYFLYLFNDGEINSKRNAGGLVALSPSLIVHGGYNMGKITGSGNVGGIAGITPFNQFLLCNNYGEVQASGGATNLGGIAGAAGNNTGISYCGNYGSLCNTQKRGEGDEKDMGSLGGIVGFLGDPRTYSAADVCSIIFGIISLGGVIADVGFSIVGTLEEIACCVDAALAVVSLGCCIGFTCDTFIPVHIEEDEYEEALRAGIDRVFKHIDTLNQMAYNKYESTIDNEYSDFSEEQIKAFARAQQDQHNTLLKQFYADGGRTEDKLTAKAHNGLLSQKESNRKNVLYVKNTSEIVNTVIGWVATAVCLGVAIASCVATFGGASICAGAAVVAGIAGGLIGGSSSIAAGVYDFTENTSLVAQCYNMGNIDPGENISTGGIAGEIGDFSTLDNCYVFGNLLNKDTGNCAGGIVGVTADETSITGSILFSKEWPNPQYGNIGGSVTVDKFESIYLSDETSQYGRTNEEMFTEKAYEDLKIDWKYWSSPDNTKMLPFFTTSKYLVD